MIDSVQGRGEVAAEDFELMRRLFPLAQDISDETQRDAVLVTWVRQWRKSSWEDPQDCPHANGLDVGRKFSLVKHVNAGTKISLHIAQTLIDDYEVDVDMDRLLGIALLHDVSKICELEASPDGKGVRSRLGSVFPHATLGAVEAHEAGVDDMICKSIILHPYHPPHTYIKPACLELLIHTWADHGAADTLTFVRGGITHLEKRREFEAIAIGA
jgi:hypothetical protein